MKTCLEDPGQDLWSSKGGDSDALILPVKKGDKKRAKKQVHEPTRAKTDMQLSKLHKRKLKKLEEEEEKALLLSKSIETLEKCKIRDDVYSLLLSSRNIGQVETGREKRRRVMQFSKVGLEMSRCGQTLKRNDSLRASIDMGLDTVTKSMPDLEDSCFLQPAKLEIGVPSNMPVSLGSFQKSVSDGRVRATGESLTAFPVAEVADDNIVAGMLDDARHSSPSSCLHNIAKDRTDQSPKTDISNKRNRIECSFQSVRTSPTVVYVLRPKEIESKRKDLPIVMMEQEIMEAINENLTVIICGETGCGKTTQVPQFLYEAGFGSNHSTIRSGIIGVTQPRRVAVLATAKRVAFELGLCLGKEVGFQVRHDKRVGDRCSIKYMTDGILLREVQSDFLLRRYSVIILDEAHERSLNTDILVVMLSRIVEQRQLTYEEQHRKILSGETISPENKIFPLKLVLMSATLRVEDFVSNKKIFPNPPPVIEVPTRQYPVTIHFARKTGDADYVREAYKKVLSIHKRLPAGGILVFVTGQREVEYLCKKLRNTSRKMVEIIARGNMENEASAVSEENSDEEYDAKEIIEAFEMDGNTDHQQTDGFSSCNEDYGEEDGSDFSYDSETDSDLEVEDDGNLNVEKTSETDGNIDDILGDDGILTSLKAAFDALAGKCSLNPSSEGKQVFSPKACSNHSNSTLGKIRLGSGGHCVGAMRVLPLYAMLPSISQLRVFEEIKEGERLVVVATNVAETSLTIPGIKYVVDPGKEKVKKCNSSSGMEAYEVQWISKASAAQRAGRAGRIGPGHCYRLYTSAAFSNKFTDFSEAEISKIPLNGVVLLLKSMGINKVEKFPFPMPPGNESLEEAHRCLKALEALDQKGSLTPLGKAMALYPLSPRHSHMLLTVIQILRKVRGHKRANLVLGYTVSTAAAMSMSSPFIRQSEGTHNEEECLNQDEKSAILEGKKNLEKEEKMKLKVARLKFSNPSSDALNTAYALQCFELSGNPVEFCNENALHLKTMEEMSKLRKQLLQLVFTQISCHGLEQEFSWTHGTMEDVEVAWKVPSNKHPLSLDEEGFLGQAICAGWADRVAKRIRATSGSSGGDGKNNVVCYQACAVTEKVFLHRWSALYRTAPKYLVYNELVQTGRGRSYILGATRVTPNWLVKYGGSLCSFSAPLADPKPYYEPLADQVVCFVNPTFGPHLWKLPLHILPIKDDLLRVAVFAYSLLEGHVLPCLRSVKKFMAAPPACILRPEALGHSRVGNLLSKLKKMARLRTIDNCAMLREAWNENPRELHSEIMDWFQKGFHDQFETVWVEMQREVLLDTKERFPEKVKMRGKVENLFLQ